MRKYFLGQHFLRSLKVALTLVGHSNLKKRDLVVEIGAGSGVLTHALALRSREVWAVEKDGETAEKLRGNLEKRGILNVRVFQEDFLEFELPGEPYKVVANPPFEISAAILKRLIRAENPPEAIYLVLQKQFALKLLNNGRHYTSQLGTELTEKYATRIRLPIKREDFTPPPGVPCVWFEARKVV